jgi:hypothetical protein
MPTTGVCTRRSPKGRPRARAFEALLRRAIEIGLVPEAAGREEAWIAERIAQHRQPRDPLLRRLADGRWRRITERYLADGGMVSYSIDVTQLVEQGQALQQARQEVEGRQTRLQEALDLLPLAFTLYDADDRLLLASGTPARCSRSCAACWTSVRPSSDIVRANHAAGGLPELSLRHRDLDRSPAGVAPLARRGGT